VVLSVLSVCTILSYRVWSVRFNPHYDQLVLTSSSDSQVVLTRLASIASEPVRVGDDEDVVVYQYVNVSLCVLSFYSLLSVRPYLFDKLHLGPDRPNSAQKSVLI